MNDSVGALGRLQEEGPVIVSSGGLNPSNRGAGFANLARGEKTPEVIAAVTAQCEAELRSAGINVTVISSLAGRGEVPSAAIGSLSMWGFQRAWYYWVATGPGLPAEVGSSRALVLYVEPDDFPLKGAFVEVGMALANNKTVVVCAPGIALEGRTMSRAARGYCTRACAVWITSGKRCTPRRIPH